MTGFDKAMDAQRAQSRSKTAFSKISDAFKKLTSRGTIAEFVGHSQTELTAKIILLVRDGQEVEKAGRGDEIEIVTEATPFYGEAGGQVGDTGRISGSEFEVEVTDTIKDPTGLIIHKGRVLSAGSNRPDGSVDRQLRKTDGRTKKSHGHPYPACRFARGSR